MSDVKILVSVADLELLIQAAKGDSDTLFLNEVVDRLENRINLAERSNAYWRDPHNPFKQFLPLVAGNTKTVVTPPVTTSESGGTKD